MTHGGSVMEPTDAMDPVTGTGHIPPDVLAAERRKHARTHSERDIRWGGRSALAA
ncbi:hypothetical protein ACFZAG_34600 [Streptomyces sp. NPDC012403]|uniref:hypothetical protein n=1 Tax=Streptomyces sp. NPDC012403 TaxID=3364831 RepID=UPI0036E10F80